MSARLAAKRTWVLAYVAAKDGLEILPMDRLIGGEVIDRSGFERWSDQFRKLACRNLGRSGSAPAH